VCRQMGSETVDRFINVPRPDLNQHICSGWFFSLFSSAPPVHYRLPWSQDSAVGIATGYGLDDKRSPVFECR
jgi:hypothetical protein